MHCLLLFLLKDWINFSSPFDLLKIKMMRNPRITGKEKKYDVVGPICESGDILGKEREFSGLKEGDFLAILDTGAYGYTMSSCYNSRPRAAEILLSRGMAHKIREAESYDDLVKNQTIPEHLKQEHR